MDIIYKKRFEKNFKVLPEKIKNRFYDRLQLFIEDKNNNLLNNHSVGRAFPNCRSINITGDYRAIFEDGGDKIIFITIGTHSELY
jgi:mRNA-degrading endonuclease YafQ of YafQ-DinJ toxin-antitoxin module